MGLFAAILILLFIVIGVGGYCVSVLALAFFGGGVSRKIALKATMSSIVYFCVSSFMIIGTPFGAPRQVTNPLYGIILTLPWSACIVLFTGFFEEIGIHNPLAIGAALNAIILALVLFLRWSKKLRSQTSDSSWRGCE